MKQSIPHFVSEYFTDMNWKPHKNFKYTDKYLNFLSTKTLKIQGETSEL